MGSANTYKYWKYPSGGVELQSASSIILGQNYNCLIIYLKNKIKIKKQKIQHYDIIQSKTKTQQTVALQVRVELTPLSDKQCFLHLLHISNMSKYKWFSFQDVNIFCFQKHKSNEELHGRDQA